MAPQNRGNSAPGGELAARNTNINLFTVYQFAGLDVTAKPTSKPLLDSSLLIFILYYEYTYNYLIAVSKSVSR